MPGYGLISRYGWCLTISLALLMGLLCFFAAKSAFAVPATPPDFADTLVTNVSSPTALAFTPDGRMLIATQPGKLRVYGTGSLLTTPALDLNGKLCTNSERGLLGVAVDPSFETNNHVYLYYTTNESGSCKNRVSRFTLSGDTVVSGSETVLIDNIHSTAGNHNGGDLHFGKDGYLYVSVGDGGCDYANDSGCAGANDAARDQHVLLGKILRVTPDGAIPATNPYLGSDSARCNTTGRTDPGKKCQETFASGLRNPFRMAFDPNVADTRFFINDVGQNIWEEIDEGKAGADYGWNLCEGNHDNPNRSGSVDCSISPYTPPIHEYNHNTGCESITGGAFVPNGVWPTEYDNSYLFGDYVCGKIFKLTPRSGGGYDRTEFVTGLGGSSAVAMTFDPYASSQSLYYTSYADGGQVRRIDYTGSSNHAPTAAVAATPTSGSAPLAVGFDGSGSRDQDSGDVLTYLWDFGDETETETTTTPTTNHTYTVDGTYTATLRVQDDSGATSAPVTVRLDVITIDSQAPSAPAITAPPNNSYDRDGGFTIRGTGTPNTTVEVFEGSTSKGKDSVGSGGTWSRGISGAAAGAHTYTAKATNKAGHTSSPSAPLTVIVDKTKPAIAKDAAGNNLVTPASGATGVALDAVVTVTFSEKTINPATLTNSTFRLTDTKTGQRVPASVSYDEESKKATLTPSGALLGSRKYKAQITTGVKDLAANSLSKGYYWTFITASS